jgi:hypothetical protein
MIHTNICSLAGCCTTQGENAWGQAARMWSCIDIESNDLFCGTCCFPCQVGIVKSNIDEQNRGVNLNIWCPYTIKGCLYCIGTAACCGIVLADMKLVPVINDLGKRPDDVGLFDHDENVEETCCWASCGLCTCAPCIFARYAANPDYMYNDYSLSPTKLYPNNEVGESLIQKEYGRPQDEELEMESKSDKSD